MDEVLALAAGQTVSLGGGACPVTTVTRLTAEAAPDPARERVASSVAIEKLPLLVRRGELILKFAKAVHFLLGDLIIAAHDGPHPLENVARIRVILAASEALLEDCQCGWNSIRVQRLQKRRRDLRCCLRG